MERVMAAIASNLRQRVSRTDAARLAHLEPGYFSKRFRKATGSSFAAWSAFIRTRAAEQLLAASDLSIQAVALAVGYQDLTTFERNFRKLTGRTPRAYRASVSRSTQNAEQKTHFAERKTQNAETPVLPP
jgi:AraC-like DNA-binding protein